MRRSVASSPPVASTQWLAGRSFRSLASLLAKYGYQVTVYERKPNVGGRNGAIRMDGFTFDIGPTFMLMASFLRQGFELAGRRMEDYLDLKPIDPLYRLSYADGRELYFSGDYEQNVREVASAKSPSADPSFYVHNPSHLDPTMAPAGKSALYVLVPVPNNRSGINWDEEGPRYRKKLLDLLETRAKLTDLRKHIVAERMITPADWAQDMCVYEGATFNLAHNFGQMLCWRPHNEFEDIDDCYLVGGGTHPGSGLPTIYESGRISAMLLAARDGITIPQPPPYKLAETRAGAAAN
jgi:phytoene dehydrogenase-like protein